MKRYKAKIIEDIVSGTLVKTKTIEAKDEEEAQKFVKQEGDIGWEEELEDAEYGNSNNYSLEEVEEEKMEENKMKTDIDPMFDIAKMMKQQIDNDSYLRWSTRYQTYIELGKWISSKLDEPGYNKLSIGADILNHLIKQTESTKDIMENTEMGKTLKATGTK